MTEPLPPVTDEEAEEFRRRVETNNPSREDWARLLSDRKRDKAERYAMFVQLWEVLGGPGVVPDLPDDSAETWAELLGRVGDLQARIAELERALEQARGFMPRAWREAAALDPKEGE